MEKKVLGIAVILMTVAMLAASMVGLAQAGKGQEKQYFKLYIVGAPDQTTGERRWTPDPVTGPRVHGRDYEWGFTDVLQVTIGDTTYSPPDVSYSCTIDGDYNVVTWLGHQRVRETVTFYCFSEPATLEILTIGSLAHEGVVFTGHGTGALEGVKVQGTTWAVVLPPLAVTREGTIMGWPT
ncbi:MAG: hypothetical protein NWE80_02845 [Candidatus Bathyarchaeota archaeon]|nr:hypothetical protein [Candidatus Bathyarchaeota archaeon]